MRKLQVLGIFTFVVLVTVATSAHAQIYFVLYSFGRKRGKHWRWQS